MGLHVQAVASFEAALAAQPDFAEALEDGARRACMPARAAC